jgi:hypothetical protein
MAKTMAPALVDFLNPEPWSLSSCAMRTDPALPALRFSKATVPESPGG